MLAGTLIVIVCVPCEYGVRGLLKRTGVFKYRGIPRGFWLCVALDETLEEWRIDLVKGVRHERRS